MNVAWKGGCTAERSGSTILFQTLYFCNKMDELISTVALQTRSFMQTTSDVSNHRTKLNTSVTKFEIIHVFKNATLWVVVRLHAFLTCPIDGPEYWASYLNHFTPKWPICYTYGGSQRLYGYAAQIGKSLKNDVFYDVTPYGSCNNRHLGGT
jgi:hypothetical protein